MEVNNPSRSLEGVVALYSVLNPPEITSSQNNYLIANLKVHNLVILTSSNNFDITGIDSTGIKDNQIITFRNGNANGKRIKFVINSGSSLAENRFFYRSSIDLRENDADFSLIYDKAIGRWRKYN